MAKRKPGKESGTRRESTGYAQIAADLLRRLNRGEWPTGSRFPSRRQLVREYGAGERTIRLALNELKAGGRVVMRPRGRSAAALGVSAHDVLKNSVAVVFNCGLARALNAAYISVLWRGMCRAFEAAGCSVIVLQHRSRWRTELPLGLRDLPVSGVLLLGAQKSTQLTQYEGLGKPVVAVDQPVQGSKLNSVCVDNYAAAYDATKRLIELGHRRIAFVHSLIKATMEIDPDSRERNTGFLAACRDGGLREKDIRVFTTFLPDSGRYRALLETRPPFTAVLCSDIARAMQIAKIAKEQGIPIPRGLSLVGFRAAAQYPLDVSGPCADFERMGHAAVELLLNAGDASRVIRVPTQWHSGDTMAAPNPSGLMRP